MADSHCTVRLRFVFVRFSYVNYYYIETNGAVHTIRFGYRPSYVRLPFVRLGYVWKKSPTDETYTYETETYLAVQCEHGCVSDSVRLCLGED